MSTNLYNNKIELIFDEKNHIYRVGDRIVPGTTTILGVINKPMLMGWAVGQAMGFIENAIRPGQSYDEIQLKQIIEEAGKAHYKKSKTAADMGNIVHEWIAKHIAEENPTRPVNKSCLNAIDQFLKWEKEHNVRFLESEKVLYSIEQNYAGTMDFMAEVDGKVMIGDFKTSKAIYDEYWLQVAAYEQAYREEYPNQKIDGALIVRIGKDASLEVQERDWDYELDKEAFNAALTLYRRLKTMKDLSYSKLKN